MTNRSITMVALSALLLTSTAGHAAPIVNKKLGQFGLEPRLTCGKWIKPWGGSKICVGTGRTEFLQHRFRLVVDGPPPAAAALAVVNEAAAAAAAAAISVGVGTQSIAPGASIAIGLAAAKTTFVSYLLTRGFTELINSYDVKIDHETFWS